MTRRWFIPTVIVTFLLIWAGYALKNEIFGSLIYPDPSPYKAVVEKYASAYGLDPCFTYGVIGVESRGNPNARSRAGATGLMQIMPGTAKLIAKHLGETYRANAMVEPETNVRFGSWLLNYNFSRYGSVRNVLVAYNGGGARVKLADAQLPRETRAYTGKVTAAYNFYLDQRQNFGLSCSGRPFSGSTSSLTISPPAEKFPEFTLPKDDFKFEEFYKEFLRP